MSPSDLRSAPLMARFQLALPVSLAFHAGLIYAVNRVPWYAPDIEPSPLTSIVWITAPPPMRKPAAETPISDELPVEDLPEPVSEDKAEPEKLDRPVVIAPEPQIEAPQVNQTGESLADDETEAGAGGIDYVTREVDWDEERRRAVSRLMDENRFGNGYASFSTDAQGKKPAAAELRPSESIFDAPTRRPSALTPGRTRTRFGYWASRVCNELSGGGIGIFGLASICVDDGPAADYFGHLRPAYMEKLPECEKVETAPLDFEFTGDPAALSTSKCRLVVRP